MGFAIEQPVVSGLIEGIDSAHAPGGSRYLTRHYRVCFGCSHPEGVGFAGQLITIFPNPGFSHWNKNGVAGVAGLFGKREGVLEVDNTIGPKLA